MDLRKSFLGTIWGISLILYEIGDDSAMGKGWSWPASMLVFALASILIFKPKKDWVWLILGFAVPIQILLQLPMIKNHAAFFAVFSVAIAVSYLTSKFSRKNPTNNWLERNEPFLRVIFLLGYGAAAISKLNTGFFDYTISCANSLAVEVFTWLPFQIPFTTFAWLPYLVAATELFVFIGLIFKVTRPWAIALAAVFHLALSLNPTSAAIAFNPALYSMLVLFLNPSATQTLTFKFREFTHHRNRLTSIALLSSIALLATFIFFKLFPLAKYMMIPSFTLRILYSLAMVVILIYGSLKFRKSELETRGLAIPSFFAAITVAVIVLNAASPYLGGKTGATFTMFSNLRVEGGKSNHFFIPRLPVESAQDDLVEIKDSTNKTLKAISDHKELITWITFQQVVASSPAGSVTYVRNGKEVTEPDLSQSDILVSYDPFWGSILHYRVVPIAGTCAW